MAKSLPIKSADVPEYSSPSVREKKVQLGTNDSSEVNGYFLELIKAEIKPTDQQRG